MVTEKEMKDRAMKIITQFGIEVADSGTKEEDELFDNIILAMKDVKKSTLENAAILIQFPQKPESKCCRKARKECAEFLRSLVK